MTMLLRPRTLLLFVGDIAFFTLSLWLSLFLRTFEVPSQETYLIHLLPFSILFLVWVITFFIAGLYENRFVILARSAIGTTLLSTQTVNVVLAALFFFLIPFFGITPKTLLFIYLCVSFLMVLLWRVILFPLMFQKADDAVVIGEGREIEELLRALRQAPHAPTRIVAHLRASNAVSKEIESAISQYRPGLIIADFNDERIAQALPTLLNYLSAGVRFIDAMGLYEEVMGRVALSKIDSPWVARNVSRYAHLLYDTIKRAMDIAIALPAAILSLVLYPFIAAAIYAEDGGDILISMPRVGEGGRIFNLYKFRSMSGNDRGAYGESGQSKLRVTRVGRFLRVSRLDEIPQLWGVVVGDLSLIGPRPEFPNLVAHYEREIPYYGVRHLVRPGLSGWAQLYHDNHPHHGAQVEATREKLSYDLYYLKHRSLALDAVIALKTIKKLLSRSGA